ncbi:hypothetical protein CANMA_003754 [Candida margitis]|uniref:uncharacterized protein n=1 Tax=Candida margitis TaxID=1775924 RepID=UPI002225C75C|nr:uncharacterized protein CANMA_003754 [Candida margitis]KAI5961777.1 hypothetical protein CANMA_003754 [Candida margitis]
MSQRQIQASGQTNTTNSPLSQLRLSHIDSSVKPSKPKTTPSSKASQPKSLHRDGSRNGTKEFNTDVNLDSFVQNSLDSSTGETLLQDGAQDLSLEVITKDEVKKAGALASLFLDTRNILQAECNVVDPAPNLDPNPLHRDSPFGETKISRSTFIRAEKVKSMLGVKYLHIQRIYDWQEANGSHNKHPGVEGVYNPLQILRNRKIRAKYHEYPKTLHLKTIPLACNVFSKHNQPGHRHNLRKDWKMLWAIELEEYIGDARWRIHHWNELKDPHGNYWFPDDNIEDYGHQHHHRKKHRFRQRLHDRLFEISDDEIRHRPDSGTKGEESHHRVSKISLETSTSSESDARNSKLSGTDTHHKHRLRTKVKRLYHGDLSSTNLLKQLTTSDDKLHTSSAGSEKGENILDQTHTVSGTNGSYDDKQQNIPLIQEPHEEETQMSKTNSQSVGPPTIRIEESTPDPTIQTKLQNVEIHHTKRGSSDESPSSSASNENEDGSSHIEKVDTKMVNDRQEQNLVRVIGCLTYLRDSCLTRMQYLLSIYPNYLQLVQNKVDLIKSRSIDDVLQLMSLITDESLPAFEDLHRGCLDESKSILHMVNNNYSIKIDTLLSAGDRSISEINASLSLDLRKTTERLDLLEQSLLKTNSAKLKPDFTTDANMIYKIIYLILENIIVGLLKLVWVVVNIYKAFAWCVLLVWKLLRVFI